MAYSKGKPLDAATYVQQFPNHEAFESDEGEEAPPWWENGGTFPEPGPAIITSPEVQTAHSLVADKPIEGEPDVVDVATVGHFNRLAALKAFLGLHQLHVLGHQFLMTRFRRIFANKLGNHLIGPLRHFYLASGVERIVFIDPSAECFLETVACRRHLVRLG